MSLVWKAPPDCRITPVVLGGFNGAVGIAIGSFRAQCCAGLLGIDSYNLVSPRYMALRNGMSLLRLNFGEKHGATILVDLLPTRGSAKDGRKTGPSISGAWQRRRLTIAREEFSEGRKKAPNYVGRCQEENCSGAKCALGEMDGSSKEEIAERAHPTNTGANQP